MQKYLLIVLTLIVFTPALASAQGDENVTRRRPERGAVEIQEIRQENREVRRSNVAENHAARLERRFNFYAARLSNIIARFQSRLDLLETSGEDTATVQAKLDEARSSLALAQTKGQEAIAAFRAIDPDRFSEQKSAAQAARDLAEDARQLFKDAHQALKDALKLLKAITN